MQPDDTQQQWQQPTQQPANTPYVPPAPSVQPSIPVPVSPLSPVSPAPSSPQAVQSAASETPVAATSDPTLTPVATASVNSIETPPSVDIEPAVLTNNTTELPAEAAFPAQLPSDQLATEDTDNTAQPDQDLIRWQATEYIHRDKDAVWFTWLAIVTIAMMAVAIFLMKSPTFAILIPIMAIALVIYARRPPATVEYVISTKGLYINDKLHPYSEFKSFGVVHGEEEYSVRLIPRQRFSPGLSAYFPEELGEQIVDTLATRLPVSDIKLDFIDQLLQKLRI